ncbi:hypothetical protein CNMCM5793_004164 [Aspergillus hiratsukae]|uniref:CHAT domain-containing protein n=1 Tax=Aspergillus hiratsukae TaxID=1194566 RepID=A0A8H6PRR5_9EURO|nr:hypothetical protein CNMCM5793_004164 [Aspergillus hiratsukae]KAF7159123.1 hypothetical protein CNMCM6106_006208 [Aspergillus hiratsukae]
MTTCSTADLDKAIQLARDALDGIPKDDSDRPKKLSRLAQLLNDKHDAVNTGPISERFRNGESALNEAIEVADEALSLISEHSPNRLEYLTDLATYHAARFEDGGKMSDSDRAIELMRQAVDIDNPDRSRHVSKLAEYLATRFKTIVDSCLDDDSDDDSDDESDTTEDSDKPSSHKADDSEIEWTTTSNASKPLNADADIEEAIQLAQEVLDTIQDNGPNRAEYLNNLANLHACRFHARGTLEGLEKAIDLGREAVKVTEGLRDQAKYLHRLAVYLQRMSIATIQADNSVTARDYVNEAVKLAEAAVDLSPKEHFDRAEYLDGLAGALSLRSYLKRSLDDLDRSVAVAREALKIIPDGHHTRPRYLHNLSMRLQSRWEVTHSAANTEEAIRLWREALKGTAMFPKPEADRYLVFEAGLSRVLNSRFGRTHQKAGLKAALLEYLDKAPLDDEKERPQLAPHVDESTRMKTSVAGKEATDHRQGNMEGAPNKRSGQADCLQNQVDKSANREATDVLDRRIEIAQATVNKAPDDDPNRSTYLSTLADDLASRYNALKDIADLDKSINIMREIVRLAADDHRDKPKHLGTLASLLVQKYEARDRSVDSDKGTESSNYSGNESSESEGSNHSLDTDREAMEPEHSDGTGEGSVCSERTNKSGGLDDAIQLMRDAAAILPKDHPDLPRHLNSLASHLAARYKGTEDIGYEFNHDSDYDSDYDFYYNSDGMSDSTEDPAESGNKEESADKEEVNDLDEAIELWRGAIRATGIACHGRAEYVTNLIDHLIYRYDSISDLEEAVRLIKDEVENTALNHSDRPTILKRIAGHLHSIWDATEYGGLDVKIGIRQDALNVTPEDLPGRVKFLGELASNFTSRHERTGSREDLETAIRLKAGAIYALPSGNHRQAKLLKGLSIDLHHRYKVAGEAVYREEGIRLAVEAVRMDTTQRVHYRDILSHYILKKLRHRQSMDDLNFAIDLTGEVIRATSEHHPQRKKYLKQLSTCLEARFWRTRVMADSLIASRIKSAIIDRKTDDLLQEARTLMRRANSLIYKLREFSGRKSDADERFLVAPIDAMREGHRQVTLLRMLASKFDHRYRISNDPNDRKGAKGLYTHASNLENRVAFGRISAGQIALLDHIEDENWEAARSVSEDIVKAIPRLSLPSLPRSVQQDNLNSYSHLSGDAASAVLQASGTAAEALEILEAGRGIIATFLIETQADISKLKDSRPSLYSKYVEVRDRASLPILELDRSDIYRLKDLESAIRMEEGFERFLLPPTTADLIEQAKRGPIVVFNATEIRSDALLITECDGITHLPLKKLEFWELLANVSKLVGEQKVSVGLPSTKSKRQQELQRILKWLWEVAVRPVLKKLKFLTPVASKPLPHIWWVTNGYLGLMPIHAAGYSKKTTSDYVVSSYIPTLKALQYARERDLRFLLEANTRMLITAMPRTVGLNPLATEKEVEVITETVTSMSSIAVSTLIEPPKHKVLDALGSCGIVHFACHGVSNSEDPSEGCLFLGKRTKKAPQRLTVRELGQLRHKAAQIAYLSACSTAENSSIDLANEAIHIASAFQLLGFPHVIGTLWEADNQCATEIAGAFYRKLIEQLNESGPDVSHDVVAYALHHATRKLRQKKPGNVIGWAPFIHIGA